MQAKIIEIINRVKKDGFLVKEDVDMDLISEYGIDSIEFIRIILEIEKAFEIKFSDMSNIKREMTTVNKIAEIIKVMKEEEEK